MTDNMKIKTENITKEEMMEEISLKEIIEILLRGKYIILATTLVSLIIGAAVYKLMPKNYKTTVSILANPITNTAAANDYTNKLVLPTMDITSYKQQFLNNYTLRKTIEELDLRDDEGNYITYDDLREMAEVTNPPGTNILDVDVSGGEPEEITQIANTLGKHFIDYISEVYQSSGGASAEALAQQLKVEEENLDREATRLRDYLTDSDNIDTLNTEITSLINQITSYKASLNDIERSIESDSITVTQMKALAGDTAAIDSDLRLSTSMTSGNAYTGSYQLQLDTDSSDLEKTLFTLKLADIEARLIENTNNKKSVENKLNELEPRLTALQAKRAEEQYKYNNIQREYSTAESIYETYRTQYRQALIVETSNMGNVNIKIISEAVVPVNPDNKNIILTGAIAGILGVFIGVFAVMFKSYWLSDNTQMVTPGVVKEYETEVVQG